MAKKMLIDATHAEETRVAVVDGITLAEFDYESIVRKQMKGSIYLAKVTRVEPSLQAAFVNFGGNRHGFLPFSEIHPDYFRIPVADREAFLAAQQAELEEHDQHTDDDEDDSGDEETAVEADDADDDEDDIVEVGGDDKPTESNADDEDDSTEDDADTDTEAGDPNGNVIPGEEEDVDGNTDEEAGGNNKRRGGRGRRGRGGRNNNRNNKGGRGGRRSNMDSRKVEMVGGDGADNDRPFRFNVRRQYKIQEVIKRGQIMLIQVSKEERGNKGAAVTSYLSLPGRYCVLMPNSPRAGGVSRKIANYKDRKRMKEVLDDLNVPEGMSVILRTAGVQRTKAEIKRDLDYLLRLWNNIRELTLKSSAPSVVYEEGNLIKRSIRDLYAKDIDEIHVSGDEGYKAARDFMKMLIPSHVKRVKEYKDDRVPMFHHYKVEKQIAEIGEPSVTLKSGGYLVINPTEALVSVDVNSGRATKERHIEETALKTNLEAAEEVARQLRLRDLGGLVVVDFIDMEDRRNNRKVEKKIRDALSSDRARIQVGRISSFGLLELSRQRLNPSLTEAMFKQCSECQGVGYVRTDDAAAIRALRALEEEGIKGKAAAISLSIPNDIALYILNNKRAMLADIEARYGFTVHMTINDELKLVGYEIQVLRKKGEDEEAEDSDSDDGDNDSPAKDDKPSSERGGRRRGRRGGRNRRGRNRNDDDADQSNDKDGNKPASKDADDDADGNKKKPARSAKKAPAKTKKDDSAADDKGSDEEKPKKPRGRKPKADKASSDEPKESEPDKKPAKTEKAEKPKASNDSKPADTAPKDYEVVNEAPKDKKKGWWNKIIE